MTRLKIGRLTEEEHDRFLRQSAKMEALRLNPMSFSSEASIEIAYNWFSIINEFLVSYDIDSNEKYLFSVFGGDIFVGE